MLICVINQITNTCAIHVKTCEEGVIHVKTCEEGAIHVKTYVKRE